MRPVSIEPGRSRWVAIPALIALAVGLLVPVTATTVAAAAEPAASVSTAAAGVAQETVPTGIVKAADLSQFDPTNIISDKLFFDGNAMTASEIQSFLDQRIGTCSNGKCLNVSTASISSRDARVSSSTGNLICSAIQGGTMAVSELIYRVQVACGISAKVILVTLQKEQGLTTSRAPSDWNLNAAMGQACPDTAPCDPAYRGLGPQIVGGVTQLKTYSAARFGKQPGSNYIQYNPNAGCGGTTINIQNWATASLYTYTPYQPNAAALAAGYGLGDSCSSYGNRNFYQYYVDWFGSTQGRDTKDDPFGNVELVQTQFGGFQVRGWAIDPNSSDSIQVHVYVDGVGYPTVANLNRPDVGAAYPGKGNAHGFDFQVPARSFGTANICIYGINVGAGDNTRFGCVDRESRGGSPIGLLESAVGGDNSVTVTGWAIDPDTSAAIEVHVYADSVGVPLRADVARPDVGSAYPAYGANHGFRGTVNIGPGTRQVCAYALNVGSGSTTTLGCISVVVTGQPDLGRAPIGNFESATISNDTATITGWALDPDTTKSITIQVSVNGAAAKTFTADKSRPDVGAAYPSLGSAHGFVEKLTLAAGSNQICVTAINTGAGGNSAFGCRTVTATAPDRGRVPIGNFDELKASGDTLTVRGWALDPDTPMTALTIQVTVNGQQRTFTADKTRTDVAAAYPGTGSAHGFEEKITLPPGTNEVCVTPVNTGTGGNRSFGCRTAQTTQPDLGRVPVGNFDSAVVSGDTVTVRGWSLDQDTPMTALTIQLSIDGQTTNVTANKARSDVAAAYPGTGSSHGFEEKITLSPGSHQICVTPVNTGPGGNRSFGCRTVTVAQPDRGRAPVGNFESLTLSGTTATATGWTLDPDTDASIEVHLYVNGVGKAYIANKARPDVGNAYPSLGAAHGFSEQLALNPGNNTVCAYGINTGPGGNTTLGCRSVNVAAAPANRAPIGFFESITPAAGGATVAGWAIDPDTTAPIEVHVYVDGVGQRLVADKLRPDVGAAYRLGDNHGFNDLVPMSSGAHNVCVYGIDTAGLSNALIGCRPVTVP